MSDSSSRPPTPARRNARTHAAVVEAAVTLAAERGYNGVTIEAVAARAGAGKQTIYRWWPNKAALFLEAYLHLAPDADIDVDSGSAADDLEGLLGRLFRIYRETPAGAVLAGLIAEAQGDDAIAAALRDHLVARSRDLVDRVLRRAEERGELAPGTDGAFAADMMSGAVWFRLLLGHAPLGNAFARRLTRYIFKGMSAP